MADNDDLTFSKLLSRHFRSAADKKASLLINRTRIDARTVGYPSEKDETKVTWYGMTPVSDDEYNDEWRVVIVEEAPNEYLSQVSENERLVKVAEATKDPMSFEKAIERLAVWEMGRMMKGSEPLMSQDRDAVGRHYFRNLALRRGYLIDTHGNMVEASDILPKEGTGKFLKSDLEALARYRAELQGADKLDQLMSTQEPLFITMEPDTTVQQDLESFGEIALFEKMHFFAEILVEYSKVQLQYIEEFYGHPERFADNYEDKLSLADRVNYHRVFFNQDLVDRMNHTREQFAETIFKYFHVREEDWHKPLDFGSDDMRKGFMKNPDSKETYEYMTREIKFPLDAREVEAMLVIAARAMVFCREMLKDSPQKDALERKGIYKNSDINDLLNFLDLLEVKHMYTELAEGVTALPHTIEFEDMKARNIAFKARVDYLVANLKDSADWSPAQEQQIQDFIKAKSGVYLIDKVKALPDKLANAHQYVSDAILPRPHQLSLDLDVKQKTLEERYKDAAPTRSKKRKGLWGRMFD